MLFRSVLEARRLEGCDDGARLSRLERELLLVKMNGGVLAVKSNGPGTWE